MRTIFLIVVMCLCSGILLLWGWVGLGGGGLKWDSSLTGNRLTDESKTAIKAAWADRDHTKLYL